MLNPSAPSWLRMSILLSPESAARIAKDSTGLAARAGGMALVGDAGSLRTLLQALANAPSRLPRKTRFLPLKWVDAHIDAATLAVAIDWIQTLSTPEERVREIGSQRTANRALDVKTLDLLWEGSAAWLSQPGPDSDDAFAQSLLGLLRPVHPSNRMDEAELVWLNRLIRCRPDAPPLEVFENFNSSYHARLALSNWPTRWRARSHRRHCKLAQAIG